MIQAIALAPGEDTLAGAARPSARPAKPGEARGLQRVIFGGRVVVATLALALFGLAAALFGPPLALQWHPFIVYTGSMEPAITRGSVVMVQPVTFDQLSTGDVITFAVPQNPGLPVTHRIVSVEHTPDGAGWQVTTKGDANPAPDIWTVSDTQSVGRVVYSIPVAGFALVWLSMPVVKLAAMAAILLLVVARMAVAYVQGAKQK
jgi:signal peptidase I